MKRKLTMALVTLAMLITYSYTSSATILATDFAGNESYYRNFCSTAHTTQEEANICIEFKKYTEEKSAELGNQVASMSNELAALKENISQLSAKINEYNDQIANLQAKIEESEQIIIIKEQEITRLDGELQVIQAKIDVRDQQVKDRMLAEQPNIGTNIYFDFLMGAKDLMDLIRTMEGIQRITENDQDQIKQLAKDHEELKLAQDEQKRLKQEALDDKLQNEADRAVVQQMQAETQKAVDEYNRQRADLEQKMRSAEQDVASMQAYMPFINTAVSDGTVNTSGFIRPVSGARISAGTWHYSSGGVHMGTDYAVGVGTPILAPANAYVMYANNPCPTYSKGLGDGCGKPWGGGNSVALLTSVNGVTYGLSFFHMSQNGQAAKGKSYVAQGEVIGLVGTSGNSTGPHCHIEIYNLGSMGVEAAAAQFRRTGDFAYGLGWNSLATTCDNRGAPCRMRPETVLP